jgi:hypothetical protein
MPLNLTIRDRFVGFTGDFREFTRKTCFEEVRKLGGVPSDPDMFLDYLFVSEKRIISNQLFAAIYYRRVYGNPLILREADWIKIAAGPKRGKDSE